MKSLLVLILAGLIINFTVDAAWNHFYNHYTGWDLLRSPLVPKPTHRVTETGMCDVIVEFVVTFKGGHKEFRAKWIDHETAEWFKNASTSEAGKKALAELGIESTEAWNIVEVLPYDCAKGPQ